VIKLIFEKNKENYVQLFYQNHNKTADIYIIDELGGLYHQKVNIEKNCIHINHFMLFLDSIIKRMNLSVSTGNLLQDASDSELSLDLDDMDSEIESDEANAASGSEIYLSVFEVKAKTPQNLILKDQFSRMQTMPVHFFRIQVIADIDDNGKRLYIIYANGKEYSSFEYGKNLYNTVAEEVVNARQSKQRYPIYITDIDLSDALIEVEANSNIQITQLLKFKFEIERRLNLAIKNL